jgi:rod shape-determining protein MreC
MNLEMRGLCPAQNETLSCHTYMLAHSRAPYWNVIVVLLLLTLLVLCRTAPARRLGRSLMRPFHGVAEAVSGSFARVAEMMPWRGGWREERMVLEKRLRQLEATLAVHEDLRRDNEELRKQLSLPPLTEWRALVAPVIGREPETWNEELVLGKGEADGVRPGYAVLSGPNLLGRVVSCDRHSSRVAMTSSPLCRLGVRVGDTDAIGVCTGQSRGQDNPEFAVDYLPVGLEITPDMMFVTSGLGGWMPPGLPVGQLLPQPDGQLAQVINHSSLRLRGKPLASCADLRYLILLLPDIDNKP